MIAIVYDKSCLSVFVSSLFHIFCLKSKVGPKFWVGRVKPIHFFVCVCGGGGGYENNKSKAMI